jgi:hypothetical protein
MGVYKLPIGIRVPSHDEYPSSYNIADIESKRSAANIVEGYKLASVADANYKWYAEVNIDCDRLWSLFLNLSDKLIPDIAYGIFAFKDSEHNLSTFTGKETIMELFNQYKFELVNDGYLEFGIAHYDNTSLNEILVKSFKYIQVWGTDKSKLIDVLNSFGLKEYEHLGFIDDFPVVSLALNQENAKGSRHYSVVMEEILKQFESF